MKFFQRLLILSLPLVSLTFAVASSAATLNERQLNQKIRIAEGIDSGELTLRETTRLLNGQAELQRMENRAKADGVVTPKERARLQRIFMVLERTLVLD